MIEEAGVLLRQSCVEQKSTPYFQFVEMSSLGLWDFTLHFFYTLSSQFIFENGLEDGYVRKTDVSMFPFCSVTSLI